MTGVHAISARAAAAKTGILMRDILAIRYTPGRCASLGRLRFQAGPSETVYVEGASEIAQRKIPWGRALHDHWGTGAPARVFRETWGSGYDRWPVRSGRSACVAGSRKIAGTGNERCFTRPDRHAVRELRREPSRSWRRRYRHRPSREEDGGCLLRSLVRLRRGSTGRFFEGCDPAKHLPGGGGARCG